MGVVNGRANGHAALLDDTVELPQPSPTFELPELIERDFESFSFLFHDHHAEVEFENIHRGRDDGIVALVHVYAINKHGKRLKTLYFSSLNLISDRARTDAIKKLTSTVDVPVPWDGILRWSCEHGIEYKKTGEPVVDLDALEIDLDYRYLLGTFLPLKEATLVYADGGQGKSTLATAIAIAITTNRALPGGLKPLGSGPVLYLDWETRAEEVARRLHWLARGMNIPVPRIKYRRQTATLVQDQRALNRIVHEIKPALVVIDSAIMAVGGEPKDAQPVTDFFAALRRFDTTSLVLSHVSKEGADDPKRTKSAYGSVFFRNWPRSVWELKSLPSAHSNTLDVILVHRKANYNALERPIGLSIRFDRVAKSIEIASSNALSNPDLAGALGLAARIRELLARRGRHSTKEIAQALDASEATVRSTLRRMPEAHNIGGSGGRGNDAAWELRATVPDEDEAPF